jgi:cytochrome c nitrite reductase small subunit
MKLLRGRLAIATLAGTLIGLPAGIGAYTFVYAKGGSYLTNDPRACANCHIMQDHYDAWSRSSHRSAATCNDCHVPVSFVGKYASKASNGFWHSYGFTTGNYPDPLRIKPGNRDIVERSCRKCHVAIVDAIDGPHRREEHLSCVRCHASVGHPRRQ